jgi:hypothetical protein
VYPEKTTNLSQVTVSFIGGGNRSNQRKPSTCSRSLSVLWWRKPVYPEKTTNLSQVTVSFIGGGNRSTQRKPPTCRRSLSVLMVEETGVPRENHQPVAGHCQCYWWRKQEYPEKTINLLQVTVSFNGGGNRCTHRKPPTCRRSLTNFII